MIDSSNEGSGQPKPDARQRTAALRAASIRADAHNRADAIRNRAAEKAARVTAKGEYKAARVEDATLRQTNQKPRKVRLDVHGRQKPLLRGWIHAAAAPLSLAACIVLICLARGAGLKWACAVFMACSLVLFANSAAYHLGDWSKRTTDVLRRIDHVNIFLLIAGTYTPISFALSHHWRNLIIVGMWVCTVAAMLIHVIWINAPRWLYTAVYVIFGVSGVSFLWLFWVSPSAGPAVVILLAAGGACYIAGAIVYALRKPDPWPHIFGFHEIFHLGTVAGYACHMVAIYMVIVALR
ncbi:PAQR family membrane homeostasis protein TrhA [Bifidobacterium bombi]|uniref:Hemolysin III-like membrane protein n=1 Tax=Bifidobacterium bombi DSM 19703 TaxID=1341695 RepID=A0A080N1Z6_9BIFI|nr:hemolysin III family protein [Bifidobacterium bombi]KFF30913.1 hemolysin III-like membrane protein [Bifidobacterium bombi DSM 19703]